MSRVNPRAIIVLFTALMLAWQACLPFGNPESPPPEIVLSPPPAASPPTVAPTVPPPTFAPTVPPTTPPPPPPTTAPPTVAPTVPPTTPPPPPPTTAPPTQQPTPAPTVAPTPPPSGKSAPCTTPPAPYACVQGSAAAGTCVAAGTQGCTWKADSSGFWSTMTLADGTPAPGQIYAGGGTQWDFFFGASKKTIQLTGGQVFTLNFP